MDTYERREKWDEERNDRNERSLSERERGGGGMMSEMNRFQDIPVNDQEREPREQCLARQTEDSVSAASFCSNSLLSLSHPGCYCCDPNRFTPRDRVWRKRKEGKMLVGCPISCVSLRIYVVSCLHEILNGGKSQR